MPAFPNVAKIQYEGPNSKNRWRSAYTKRTDRRQVDTHTSGQRGVLAHPAWHGRRSLLGRHHAAALEEADTV